METEEDKEGEGEEDEEGRDGRGEGRQGTLQTRKWYHIDLRRQHMLPWLTAQ